MRSALLWMVSLVSAGIGPAAQASVPASPATRAAHYYAEGLDRPLQQVRTAGDAHLVELLDALTLFPQTPVKKKRADGDTLVRDAGEYDLHLFARYGASLRACPPEERATEYLESLAALVELNLTGFQALDAAATGATAEQYMREENELTARLRAGNREDCIAARMLGEDLMRLMDAKLQPWNVGDPGADDPARSFSFDKPVKPSRKEVARKTAQERERRETVARNFLTMAATLLQLSAYPESAARIKEIADRAGIPSAN